MNELSHFYESRGKFDTAEELLRETLRSSNGSISEATFPKTYRLASVNASQKRYGESELLFKQAVWFTVSHNGLHDWRTINMISWLAHVLNLQGKFSEVEELRQQHPQTF